MATPVLNNGIFYREVNWNLNSRYLDEWHVSSLLAQQQPVDLGPVALWAMAKYRQAPLYNLALISKKNYIEITDPQGRYMWSTPIPYEMPQIIEDIEPGNTKKGQFDTTFRLKFNKDSFFPGQIITPDNFNGPEVYIVDIENLTTNGAIYKCKLASNMNSYAYLDNLYVQPGMRWAKKTSAYNQWSTKFQGVSERAGMREYYNYCPNVQAGGEYHVTEGMLEKIMQGKIDERWIKMVEMFKVEDDKLRDPMINDFTDLYTKLGGEKGLRKAINDGRVSVMLLTKVEADLLEQIRLDIENELMWGQGGRLVNENNDAIIRTPGLWKQFDLGYKYVYDLRSFSLEMFRSMIFNFYEGRTEPQSFDPNRVIEIHTGRGGMALINQAIKNDVVATGFTVQAAGANSIGAVDGDRMNLRYGFNFASMIVQHIGVVNFVYNPALDPYNANDITNPIINGARLSSYSFLIFDIADNLDSNIRFLKYYKNPGPKWIYTNGTCDWKGSNVVQSGGQFSGYKLQIKQYVPGIHVMDPTRICKMVLRNPYTGQSL